MDGEANAGQFYQGQQLAQLQGKPLVCFGPQHAFHEVREELTSRSAPSFPRSVPSSDDVCLIRSMTTDMIDHDPAHMFMNTGSQIAGRPSMECLGDMRPGERF